MNSHRLLNSHTAILKALPLLTPRCLQPQARKSNGIFPEMDRSSPSSSSSCSELDNAGSPYLDASNYSERTRAVLKSIMKSRKSWKSFRDGEVVWPLELEAALLEGLEKYVPQDTRETRILGRFPMRNRFLSDYIYQKTGKKRTAKQVGSRIQQLRDSCAGKALLALLRPYTPQQDTKRRSSSPTSSRERSSKLLPFQYDAEDFNDAPLVTSPNLHCKMSPSYESRLLDECCSEADSVNVVYIDLLPPNGGSYAPNETSQHGTWSGLPSYLSSHIERVNYVQVSQQARHLRHIDPTITLVSRSTVTARSVFTVMLEDATVFTETTTLEPAGRLNDALDGTNSPELYRTLLVPGYWETISRSEDPTRFTIEQRVQEVRSDASAPLFSAIYKFRFTHNPPTTCMPQHSHSDYLRVPGESGNSETIRNSSSFPDIALEYPVFDIQASQEALDPFIGLGGDGMLAELGSLGTQPSASWDANSPSNSLLSVSATSSRRNSVSPAGSCISDTLPNCTSHMPSPILYPANIALPTLGQRGGQVQAPKVELYLGSDYFPQDLFDGVNIVVSNPYDLQS